MPRSNKDRLAGGHHLEPAEVRDKIKRAAEVVADSQRSRQTAEPAPPKPAFAPAVSRQSLTGNSPGPVWGDVVGPLHPNVYQIVFRTVEQSAPAVRFELRAAMRSDVDWLDDSVTLDSAGMWLKPPVAPMVERPTTPRERESAINNTKLTRVVPTGEPPAPKWPQYVRPVMFPSTRKPMTAKVEIELRRDDE